MGEVSAVNGVANAEYAEQTGAGRTSSAEGSVHNQERSGMNFSAVIADALQDEMTRMSVMTRPDAQAGAGGFMPLQMQNTGIEQMILAAAASGEATDAQAALFMLCMMMQNSQDSDFSIIMQMMSAMLAQIKDDATSLRGPVMASGYDPYVLDTIDWNIFGTSMPGFWGDDRTILPLEVWRPATPAIRSNEYDRDPELYTSVIGQFRVETSERYRPFRNGHTYCNIFLWDVTSAMGAEIPHYTDPETGDPRFYPDIKGAKTMSAVEMDAWLKTHGPAYGWRQVDAETAQRYANEGRPAVTAGGSLDHVQVVVPSKDGEYDPIRGVTIAQAGRVVTSYTYISGMYSTNALQNVSYFVHD